MRMQCGGKVGPLDAKPWLPLGIEPTSVRRRDHHLRPGDLLVLYTDGITEAHDPKHDEMFGQERLDEVLCSECDDAKGLVRRVLDAVDAFTGYRPPDDDRTMLVAKVL